MVAVITEVAVSIATQHAPLSSACMPDPIVRHVLLQYIYNPMLFTIHAVK